ncbi:MAG: hypothetical protein DRR06_03740 [Gammaproteobacteria bacterium]|nr:MAG: hypothetical protein DRR06_03740 [Gammaproteobacteria bacterium]RLA54090.1 MAG: hypothetical protein DRR42_02825 [Gammaproteobacteria bacterium]
MPGFERKIANVRLSAALSPPAVSGLNRITKYFPEQNIAVISVIFCALRYALPACYGVFLPHKRCNTSSSGLIILHLYILWVLVSVITWCRFAQVSGYILVGQ